MARLVGALGSTRQGVHANAPARASGQAHIGQQAGKFCRRNKAYHALQFTAIRGQDENAGRAIQTKALKQCLVFGTVGGHVGLQAGKAYLREPRTQSRSARRPAHHGY